MNTLFNIESTTPRKEKCKSCKYFEWLDYDSGKRFFYCSLRKSNRTQNGLLKIKSNMVACNGYVKNVEYK